MLRKVFWSEEFVMETKEFEKKIRYLKQIDVVTHTVAALNVLLMEKEIVTKEELQEKFLQNAGLDKKP